MQVNPSLRQVCVRMCAWVWDSERRKQEESVCAAIMNRYVKFGFSDNIPCSAGWVQSASWLPLKMTLNRPQGGTLSGRTHVYTDSSLKSTSDIMGHGFPSLKSHLDKCLLFHLQHCNLMCLVSVANTEDGALVSIYCSDILHSLFILRHLNPLPYTATQHWTNSYRFGSSSISHTKAHFTSSLSI